MKNRKVLVTGGAGFIGSHVADAYLRAGDEVWIVDDLSSGRTSNVPSGAEFVEMDIRDPEMRNLFRDVRFDVVNHHAAQIDVRISVADPARDASINLMGLLNLTEAAIEVGTQRIVYVSSGGVVYGEPEEIPTPEGAPKLPLSPYGVTKLGGEYYLNYYRQIRGLEYVALRYSNVFGPRQDPHGEAGVVAIFCNRLLSGQALTVFGDGEQTRDYVYVKDVVAANMLASDVELTDGAGLDAARLQRRHGGRDERRAPRRGARGNLRHRPPAQPRGRAPGGTPPQHARLEPDPVARVGARVHAGTGLA